MPTRFLHHICFGLCLFCIYQGVSLYLCTFYLHQIHLGRDKESNALYDAHQNANKYVNAQQIPSNGGMLKNSALKVCHPFKL